MTSIRSGKTPDASPSPAASATDDAAARGLATIRARLGDAPGPAPIAGAGGVPAGDRRARAESLAEGLLSLLRAVDAETLA